MMRRFKGHFVCDLNRDQQVNQEGHRILMDDPKFHLCVTAETSAQLLMSHPCGTSSPAAIRP